MSGLLGRIFSGRRALQQMEPLGPLPEDRQLLRHAFKIAWPSTLETSLVALVGVVDTIMVGSLGASAIAAVGLTTQPKFVGLAFFLSLSVAVSALVARRKGQNDRASANRVLVQALMLTVILSAVISTLCVVFAGPLMRLAGSNADTHELAVSYFRIIMGGMFFNVMNIIINAAQRGAGNTKIVMRTNLTSNAVNICLNYLLIEGHLGFPALGVRGAAIATVCGTAVAFGMALYSILHRDRFLYLFFKEVRLRFDRITMGSIANIGTSTLAEQLFLRFGFLVYAMLVARLGTNAFAAHQIGMNILSISFSIGNGLSMAAVALVGQSLGEKRPDIAKIYGSFCQRMGFLCSTGLAAVLLSIGRPIFRLFSEEAEVLSYAPVILTITVIIVYCQVSQVVFSGCLRGAGDTRYVAMVSLISVAFCRPFFGWLFTYAFHMGLHGAWIGLLADQVSRLVLSLLRFRSCKWMNIRI